MWAHDELTQIGTAEELDIASRRRDGTLRDPVTIWVVRAGDDLYVRAVKGPSGPWFRGTQTRRAGRIRAGGIEKDVAFEAGDPGLNDAIDAAYRAKYGRYAASIVNSVLTPEARAATLKLVPSADGA